MMDCMRVGLCRVGLEGGLIGEGLELTGLENEQMGSNRRGLDLIGLDQIEP